MIVHDYVDSIQFTPSYDKYLKLTNSEYGYSMIYNQIYEDVIVVVLIHMW